MKSLLKEHGQALAIWTLFVLFAIKLVSYLTSNDEPTRYTAPPTQAWQAPQGQQTLAHGARW